MEIELKLYGSSKILSENDIKGTKRKKNIFFINSNIIKIFGRPFGRPN